MNKEFVLKSWELLKDATNPNNRFGINLATDDLFHRIEIDKMNSLEDYKISKMNGILNLKTNLFKNKYHYHQYPNYHHFLLTLHNSV